MLIASGARAAAVAILVAGLVGCSTQVTGTAAPATGTASTPGPSAPAAPGASDVAACRGGTCEITVSGALEIPLDAGFDVDRLAVTAVGANGVEARIETGSSVNTRVNGGRVVSRRTGSGSVVEVSRLRAGSSVRVNGIGFTVVSLDGGTAVLRLSPS